MSDLMKGKKERFSTLFLIRLGLKEKEAKTEHFRQRVAY